MKSEVKKILVALLAALLAYVPDACALRRGFVNHTLVEKGDVAVGAGFLYSGFDSRNSEYLLLVNGLDATGKVFRFAPDITFTYDTNKSFGFRLAGTSGNVRIGGMDAGLLDKDLTFSLSDVDASVKSYSASLFCRRYFGLEPSGTVGLFWELSAGYSYNDVVLDGNPDNIFHKVNMTFSPGVMLFVMPFVSLEVSVGLADLTWISVGTKENGLPFEDGSRMGGGVHLNILNCNLGVCYHF